MASKRKRLGKLSDYQTRIYKNTNDIMWMNKVHERITGIQFCI